jgi:microsomal dipeptidase-like Zn-dependent dipeptidase
VVKAAHELEISRILIMHPEFHVPSLSVAQQRELVHLGAIVEKCYLSTLLGQGAGGISEMAKRIVELGPEHCVLVTDFGQAAKGSPVAGMTNFIAALLKEGLTADQIRLMVSTNPRRLLRLS